MPSSKTKSIEPYWKSDCGRAELYLGDNLRVMTYMNEEVFHAIVTDPPYGLEFMNHEWDAPWKRSDAHIKVAEADTDESHPFCNGSHKVCFGSDGQAFQQWFWDRANLMKKVAKPGAHLMSFGGSRMFHRMHCAVEDAGWEIRDTIMWVYGCLSEDTEILTENGWRKYDSISVGDKVAAWDSESGSIQLEPVEHVTVAPYSGDMIQFKNDNTDQLVTPNHRVYQRRCVKFQASGIRTSAYEDYYNVRQASEINRWQPIKLPLAGYHDGPGIGSVAYAELLGWVWTEGGFDEKWNGVRITQSSVNPEKVQMIEDCLSANKIRAKHYTRDRQYKGRTYTEHTWFFSGGAAIQVRNSLPDKHPTWKLLWKMTLEEKRAFLDAAMLGDGSGMGFYQKDDADREWFQVLLHCLGMQGRDHTKKYCVYLHDNHETELQRRHLVANCRQKYEGIVWCVSVKSKAFVARRNGKVFITGNSGFPKGKDVSKGIDEHFGAKRTIRDETKKNSRLGGNFHKDIIGGAGYGFGEVYGDSDPVTPEAKQWDGWNSTLKPAFEPICVAQKPYSGTIAECVLKNGCGGINVDACRIGEGEVRHTSTGGMAHKTSPVYGGFTCGEDHEEASFETTEGRWPANFVHDGSDEVVTLLRGTERYFYSPKADESDRPHGKGRGHATVKPLDLMRWLVKLVCARGGTVLDPFCGSGSTGCAAVLEGMRFVGIEQSQEYADIAVGKIKLALERAPQLEELRTYSGAKKSVVTRAGSVPTPKRMDRAARKRKE